VTPGRIASGMLCIVLAGCAVARPPYQPPAPEVPARWSETTDAGTAVPQADLAWWEDFHDAELNSLIRRAGQSNLDIQLAQARLREARGRSGIAAASLQPSIHATASAMRERDSLNAPAQVLFSPGGKIESRTGQSENLFQAGFDARWELDLFGVRHQSITAAEAEADASAYDRGSVLLTLFAEVARNYVSLRGLQQQIIVARADLAAQQTIDSLVRARHAGGLASNLDVARIAGQVKHLAAQIPTLETARQHAAHRLGVLLGERPGALTAELLAAGPIPVARADLSLGLPSDLLRQRPDIQRAERQLAGAAALVGVATADLYPKFSLAGAAGLATSSTAPACYGKSARP
jgi:multidrug efflux system outer membrane protein